jgi:hypothetical protein
MSEEAQSTAEFIGEATPEVVDIAQGGYGFGWILGGFVVGAGLGGAVGYFVTRHLLEAKYVQIAEDEIDEMRKHYQSKTAALENTVAKPQLADLVREQGYTAEPPMAVTPPDAVVEAARDAEENTDPRPEPREENVFEQPPISEEELGSPLMEEDNWDWHKERSRRSPIRPYVIHRDEKDGNDTYDSVTYTYYEGDDVLCNERGEVIGKDERDALIGEANLERFGDGSGDASIVYIRNDKLEMQMEVVRSTNAFAEEVHGFQHSDTRWESIRHRERRVDDE